MLQYTVTIEGKVIINGVLITLESRNDLIYVKRYIDEYLRLTAPPAIRVEGAGVQAVKAALATAEQNGATAGLPPRGKPAPKRGGVQHPPGHTTKDYLLKVLEANPDGLYAKTLASEMQEAGWETLAERPDRAIEVIMYKHKDLFVHLPNGKWALRPAEVSLEQDKATVLRVADDAARKWAERASTLIQTEG
jgi:hypothetical protein